MNAVKQGMFICLAHFNKPLKVLHIKPLKASKHNAKKLDLKNKKL